MLPWHSNLSLKKSLYYLCNLTYPDIFSTFSRLTISTPKDESKQRC